jgi:hypothetical protein
MTIISMPRPLFDGIMFLTACDDNFILKCEWIHISGESMSNIYLSKTKVNHGMIHNVCRTLWCAHRKKTFEFLKYNILVSEASFIQTARASYSVELRMLQGVIFIVPQICAYFVDNPHYLETDSFKIAVKEHILLYFKNSKVFFLCAHHNVRHTLCIMPWFTFVRAVWMNDASETKIR